eukprot:TRINITY_DN7995_c0_g1_i1.p1 TRINITY_DN7995_c0_g1~~TRINITY_DN7995_c0_g1_i1.p1  ORF type:complete len:210 (-),score=37.17 TRINITY_DN7995_c0_g1_i1:209-838(-)
MTDVTFLEEFEDGSPRIFNINTTSITSGLFNSSLLTIGLTLVLVVIFFEVSLYALDVYYNQTFGNLSQKIDVDYEDEVLAAQLYSSYPTYYDYYASSQRSLGGRTPDFKAIIKMISTAQEIYLGSSDDSNADCRKRWFCEVSSNDILPGSRSTKAMFPIIRSLAGMGASEYLTELNEDIQEVQNVKNDSCDHYYPSCSKSLKDFFGNAL